MNDAPEFDTDIEAFASKHDATHDEKLLIQATRMLARAGFPLLTLHYDNNDRVVSVAVAVSVEELEAHAASIAADNYDLYEAPPNARAQ
jgi:hypothetical protein